MLLEVSKITHAQPSSELLRLTVYRTQKGNVVEKAILHIQGEPFSVLLDLVSGIPWRSIGMIGFISRCLTLKIRQKSRPSWPTTRPSIQAHPPQVHNEFGEALELSAANEDADFDGGGGGGETDGSLTEAGFLLLLREAEDEGLAEISLRVVPRPPPQTDAHPPAGGCLAGCAPGLRAGRR